MLPDGELTPQPAAEGRRGRVGGPQGHGGGGGLLPGEGGGAAALPQSLWTASGLLSREAGRVAAQRPFRGRL